MFAFAVTTLGMIRVAVPREQVDEARRVLLTHGDAGGSGLVVPLDSQFDAIEARLHYRFKDRGLLEHALTHKSRAAEDPSGGVVDNESLEFLGDAVLGFVVADLLYREFPEFTEGPKSKAKAALVSTTALAELSRALGLGDDLLLGKGEAKTGGRAKTALLADVFEAVIAAIYLDGGVEAARAFVEQQLQAARRRRAGLECVRTRPQVGAAGDAAGARPPAARLPRVGGNRSRPREALCRGGGGRRRRARGGCGEDQEGSRARSCTARAHRARRTC